MLIQGHTDDVLSFHPFSTLFQADAKGIAYFSTFQEQREREKQDLELAKEMAEEDDDGFP